VAIGLVAGTMLAGGLANALVAVAGSADGSMTALLRAFDPAAYAAGVLVIVVACVVAASVPALRAARIDPVTALKQE
jgi:ABC-type antimicrobial peptide transport system permease subunit